VGVRADLNEGSVHATVMPGSSDAAQVLGGHMAGLSAFLTAEHKPVDSLTLTTPDGRELGSEAGYGSGQSAGQGAGQNPAEQGSPATHSSLAQETFTNPSDTPQADFAGTSGAPKSISLLEGSHISVMA
jgi:hypothetical protein